MTSASRLLTHGGTAIVVFGLSKIHAVINGYDYTGSFRFGFSLALIAAIMLATYTFGLPDLTGGPKGALVAALKATGTAALFVSMLQLALGDKLLPRFVVLGAPLLLIPWFVLCSLLSLTGSKRQAQRARVFLVSSEDNRKAMIDDLRMEPERPAAIVGSMGVEESQPDQAALSLGDRVRETQATMLVLDRTALFREDIVAEAANLHLQGLRVRTIISFYEQWLGKLPITELERASLMFDISELHRARYWRLKRLMDVSFAFFGLLVLAVTFPFIAAITLLSGSKRVIYRQPRVGKNGRVFLMYKFATMSVHNEMESFDWAQLNDPRVTRFGRILRRTHLDELPQMVNILKGDLSLVGPRPEQPHYVETLTEVLPYYAMRYSVTPGLTGWAQVKFGYAGNAADAREKLQYDFYYLSKQGLRIDLLTLGRTLRSIGGLKGR